MRLFQGDMTMDHFPVCCGVAVAGVSCWDLGLVVRTPGGAWGQLDVVGQGWWGAT